MVKKTDVINWAKDLANRGVGVDFDGYYGTQCVDLVNWVFGKYFGRPLGGNAIDLLNSAKQNNYTVIMSGSGNYPKAGDIFVMQTYAHSYGHTGLVIEDSDGKLISSIDQNVDGNADALTVGGPARYVTRRFNQADGQIIGWIRPPYEDQKTTITTNKETEEEEDMFTVSAKNRGIGLVTGGVFYALLDSQDPKVFWNQGVKHMTVSTATFDNFQKGVIK